MGCAAYTLLTTPYNSSTPHNLAIFSSSLWSIAESHSASSSACELVLSWSLAAIWSVFPAHSPWALTPRVTVLYLSCHSRLIESARKSRIDADPNKFRLLRLTSLASSPCSRNMGNAESTSFAYVKSGEAVLLFQFVCLQPSTCPLHQYTILLFRGL